MKISIEQIRGIEDFATADEAVSFHSQADMQVYATESTGYELDFHEGCARNFAVITMGESVPELFLCLNSEVPCEQKILIDNTGNVRDVEVYIDDMQFQGTSVDRALLPDEGVVVPSGKCVVLTYVVIVSGIRIGIVTRSSLLNE